jgi:dienelactone hydrolase
VRGVSRGSQAAALLAADYPGLVRGAVLESPSSVVNVGFPDPTKPAWTLAGGPVPFAPVSDLDDADPADAQDALLPVQKISGPIVTVCGGADTVWPSCPYSSVIADQAGGGRNRVTRLSYPDAGHGPVAIASVVDDGYPLIRMPEGGTVDANVSAGFARLGELATHDIPTDDAARIDRITLQERIKAAAAAAQFEQMVAFAHSQVEDQQTQVLQDPRAVGRGIGDQIALACHLAPSEGSRDSGSPAPCTPTCPPPPRCCARPRSANTSRAWSSPRPAT